MFSRIIMGQQFSAAIMHISPLNEMFGHVPLHCKGCQSTQYVSSYSQNIMRPYDKNSKQVETLSVIAHLAHTVCDVRMQSLLLFENYQLLNSQ